jgi:Glycosyltransferase
MNILINAYAVSPGMGSEPGMGWDWCVNLARHDELYIITEGEFRGRIEAALPRLPQGSHMHFYYLPVSERVRRMCWNQGDWRFYFHYRKWQKRALAKAHEIMETVEIDVVHQLNMVGFREPGYLWKLDKPLVWGPIGGMETVPQAFLRGAPLWMRLFLGLKRDLTTLQIRFSPRIRRAFQQADALIAATPSAQGLIRETQHRDSEWIPETGCYYREGDIPEERTLEDFHIMWIGKFDFRKRLDLALRVIREVRDLEGLRFHIVGTGSDAQVRAYKGLAAELGIDGICQWHGQVDNGAVHEMMRQAHLFLFTSISETTSTVVPEAINNGLPVVCFDACGFGPLVSDKIGRKIPMSDPGKAVQDFARQIRELYQDRDLLDSLSGNCREASEALSWEGKALRVTETYQKLAGR